jgi:hypothetical protein
VRARARKNNALVGAARLRGGRSPRPPPFPIGRFAPPPPPPL